MLEVPNLDHTHDGAPDDPGTNHLEPITAREGEALGEIDGGGVADHQDRQAVRAGTTILGMIRGDDGADVVGNTWGVVTTWVNIGSVARWAGSTTASTTIAESTAKAASPPEYTHDEPTRDVKDNNNTPPSRRSVGKRAYVLVATLRHVLRIPHASIMFQPGARRSPRETLRTVTVACVTWVSCFGCVTG